MKLRLIRAHRHYKKSLLKGSYLNTLRLDNYICFDIIVLVVKDNRMKNITFVGTSLNDIREFPEEAKRDTGYQLDRVQKGLNPDDWKPMPSIGRGVKEIRVRCESGIFRTIYVIEKKEGVFVLHAFQKKTQKTSKQDLELAKKRISEIK